MHHKRSQQTEISTSETLEMRLADPPQFQDYYALRDSLLCANELEFLKNVFNGLQSTEDEEIVLENANAMIKILRAKLDHLQRSNRVMLNAHNATDKISDVLKLSVTEGLQEPRSESSIQTVNAYKQGIAHQDRQIISINAAITRLHLFRKKNMQEVRTKITKIRLINELTLKKHNIKRYITHLNEAQSIVFDVKERLKSTIPEYTPLQQKCSSPSIYSFYNSFCLEACCAAITERLLRREITVMTRNEQFPQIISRLTDYIFPTGKQKSSACLLREDSLSEKCSLLIQLITWIKVVDQRRISIKQGFTDLFRGLFLHVLLTQESINTEDFSKASSIMQHNGFTIELWSQFLEQSFQKFYVWYYSALTEVKKEGHVLQKKEIYLRLKTFQLQFQWIAKQVFSQITTYADLSKPRLFKKQYLRLILIRIFKPLVFEIFLNCTLSCNPPRTKKHADEINYYIFATLFRSGTDLYKVMFTEELWNFGKARVAQMFEKCQIKEMDLWEYHHYYRESVSALLTDQFGARSMAEQFENVWTKCVSQCVHFRSKRVARLNSLQHFGSILCQEIKRMKQIEANEAILLKLINEGKRKSEQTQEEVYGLVVRLQFTSLDYLLLCDASKFLGVSRTKEFLAMQQCVISQFFP